MTASSGDGRDGPPPWARMEHESAVAYEAFRVYRDLEPPRTFVGTARRLGKAYSLIRGWAGKHEWRRRAWQWDQEQQRQDAEVMRHERNESIRRAMRDADHVKRLAMGKFSKLVHRDPVTGELTLDESVTNHIAIQLYRLGEDIERDVERSLAAQPDSGSDGSVAAEMGRMSDSELRSLIELAKERAQQKQEEE